MRSDKPIRPRTILSATKRYDYKRPNLPCAKHSLWHQTRTYRCCRLNMCYQRELQCRSKRTPEGALLAEVSKTSAFVTNLLGSEKTFCQPSIHTSPVLFLLLNYISFNLTNFLRRFCNLAIKHLVVSKWHTTLLVAPLSRNPSTQFPNIISHSKYSWMVFLLSRW